MAIVWTKPNIKDELGEYFENSFTKAYFKKMGYVFKTDKELTDFLSAGTLTSVTRAEFKTADNMTLTDRDFDKELKDKEYAKSYVSMCEGLIKDPNMPLPAPIVIRFGKKYYGFAGNRRMNLAFRNGLRLKVFLVSAVEKKPEPVLK